jgi:hypothetical protein
MSVFNKNNFTYFVNPVNYKLNTMEIEDYLELYSSDIRTQIKTNPTSFTEATLKEVLIDTVNQLKPYRLDDYMTVKTLTNILRKYQRAVRTPDGEIDHYDEYSVDSIVLSGILLKYFKREVSFHYAYVLLQQSVNCRIAFPEDLVFRTEQEIEDAVLLDISIEKQKVVSKERFKDLLIHERKDVLMQMLHELLDYKRGKDVATVIKAMEKLQYLKPYKSVTSLHSLITDEFGDIGSVRNFSNYMNGTSNCYIQESSVDEVVVILQRL